MAQAAAKTKHKTATRAKTLKPSDRGETPAEREKRLARNAYTRAWRAQRKAAAQPNKSHTQFVHEPRPISGTRPLEPLPGTAPLPQPSVFALSNRFVVSALASTTTVSEVRATIKVLMKTHDRQATLASADEQSRDKAHLRGIVDGLRMALTMLDAV